MLGRMLKLDHEGAVPLRAQVEHILRKLILTSEYQNGALLQNEIKLAAQLGVSRGLSVPALASWFSRGF